MSFITCTRRIEFDAAHRVMGYSGKCNMLHGHRYQLEATFSSDVLSSLGMVIDFSILKRIFSDWLMENWDHNTILNEKDVKLGQSIAELTGQKIYYLKYNPTAEYMSHYLLHDICPKLFDREQVRCTKIRLYETPNCYAEAIL